MVVTAAVSYCVRNLNLGNGGAFSEVAAVRSDVILIRNKAQKTQPFKKYHASPS
jgi:hypothetical protein